MSARARRCALKTGPVNTLNVDPMKSVKLRWAHSNCNSFKKISTHSNDTYNEFPHTFIPYPCKKIIVGFCDLISWPNCCLLIKK